jgi:hypothetical protein
MTITSMNPTATTMPTASVTGQVLASKAVTIRLYNPDNSMAATTTANPDGTFKLMAAQGTYTITASAEGFLNAQGSITLVNGSVISPSVVSLSAGDLDGNGVIDPMDALTIGINYNGAMPASADLNNDGVINVLDLGILAGNYRKTGAQVWP